MALGSLYDEHSIHYKVNGVTLPPLGPHWLIPILRMNYIFLTSSVGLLFEKPQYVNSVAVRFPEMVIPHLRAETGHSGR
jgi:hypothetical protein